MEKTESMIHGRYSPTDMKRFPLQSFDVRDIDALPTVGLHFAMDSVQGGVTTASLGAPAQFLQHFRPGFVEVATAPRNIDKLAGMTVAGSFEDETIVQGVLEATGYASDYADSAMANLSNYNVNYEERYIVRGDSGYLTGMLESMRAGAQKINSDSVKQGAALNALEIRRNAIGFYGFNSGINRTYGFLNDPSLPPFVAVATGAGGDTEWSTKTFSEITKDIRVAVQALIEKSQGLIDVRSTKTILALPVSALPYLTVTTDLGMSVEDWIKKTFPQMEIVSAPELNTADGGDAGFYLYAEKVEDGGTDGGLVVEQFVPTKLITTGTENRIKGVAKGFANATAGCMWKRPYAVVRYSGI